ncbi:MAG: hypothetical protein DLM53_12760 [Candidatus Eremiobacter antarcticus]|nr:MAG: hypothetical protein DLM53_12760 [Candidatus Eremiobacter sp. RRmetagenome_bin22]
MSSRHTWAFLAAASLGLIAGLAFAPRPARVELKRRATRNASRLGNLAARESGRAARAVAAAASIAGRVAGGAARRLAAPLSRASLPSRTLKHSIATDPILSQRAIWVDAHGDTMLLHGVVDSDEEWRSADLLARLASPDGSVRNLLQVRRGPEG